MDIDGGDAFAGLMYYLAGGTTVADLFPIVTADKLASVEREIKYREYVYPRRVANKTMSQEKADREIAIMKAIADDYRKQEP
jgi:hypothetical protein